jgi:prefoldin subunit 5
LNDLQLVHQEYESTGSKLEQVKEELDEMIEEEANIIARVNKLKQAEKQMLLEIGLKGSTNKLDEELKKKIT